MILEALELCHWRSYREPRSFEFSPGLNLIVGPNEAGKSTLFEALQRALFDRHTSGARRLHQLQPLESSLGPEVRLTLRLQDQRHRVFKRFLVEPRSELYTERQGSFELDHEGDQADAFLRQLLGGRSPQGASFARHRGLAQALWYLQREEAVPAKTWSDGVREGLKGLASVFMSSPYEDQLVGRIFAVSEASFSATGRIKAASELKRLGEELEQLEQTLGHWQGELGRAESLRGQLAELERRRKGAQERLELAQGELQAAQEDNDSWIESQREQARSQQRLDGIVERNRQLHHELDALRRHEDRLETLKQEIEALGERDAELQIEVRRQRRTAESHSRCWRREVEPQLAAVAEELEELQTRLRCEDLERESQRLRQELEEGRHLRAECERKRRAMARIRAPDEAQWKALDSASEELRVLEARLAASAVCVSFDLDEPREVRAEPPSEAAPGGSEHRLIRPTTFEIAGVGRVHVRSSDPGLEPLQGELDRRHQAIAAALEAYGAESLTELGGRYEERGRVKDTLAAAEVRLTRLEAGASENEARLREISGELRYARQRSPQPLLPGIDGWARERTRERLLELEESRAVLKRRLLDERTAEEAAQHQWRERSEELREVSQRLAELRTESKVVRSRAGESLERFGSRAALTRLADASDDELVKAKAEYRRLAEGAEARRKSLQIRLKAARQQVEAEQRETGRVDGEIADRLARLEEIASQGVYGKLGDTEALLTLRRRRYEVLSKRAAAARLLSELITALRREHAREWMIPLEETVSSWVRRLTEGRYDRVHLDSDLVPRSLHLASYGKDLPVESLSFGTYEQVVVLLRLAMGYLLSEGERQMVVLDDRLVNADAARLSRLGETLQAASQRCQILLATCNPRPYETLEATLLPLDEETGLAESPLVVPPAGRL